LAAFPSGPFFPLIGITPGAAEVFEAFFCSWVIVAGAAAPPLPLPQPPVMTMVDDIPIARTRSPGFPSFLKVSLLRTG
jgi:hypothetical protein